MNLVRFLQTDPNTRKVFGKRELKIVEKQLLGVNLTQSEKNRLSRDIRKKFEFIEKVAKFSESFRLKKGCIIKEMIQETKEIILGSPYFNNIKKITVYGSAADNELTLRSDIDLAVEFKRIDLKEATIFRKKIMGEADSRVDIQVYEYLPENIRKDIKTKGIVIYDYEDKGKDKRD